MELWIDTCVSVFLLLVQQSLLVKLLSFDSVTLVLNLRCKLSADKLLFLWGNLLCKLKSLEPVLEIHSHFKSEFWLRRLKEALLGKIMLK